MIVRTPDGRIIHDSSRAFAEGDRLGVPVIPETDAKSKCGKYVHLGMELAGTRDAGRYGTMYDLIRYPARGAEK